MRKVSFMAYSPKMILRIILGNITYIYIIIQNFNIALNYYFVIHLGNVY